MVTIPELWLPVVLAAVLVFVASSVIHMFLGYHADDLAAVPDEEKARAALAGVDLPPGDYVIPRAGSMKEMSDPAYVTKLEEGPVLTLSVRSPGPIRMGRTLLAWFAFVLVVSVFVAYLAGRTLAPGADALSVVRVAGTAAFLAYAAGEWPQSIWMGRKWSTTLKNTFDGLVYALLTAVAFGWLWP